MNEQLIKAKGILILFINLLVIWGLLNNSVSFPVWVTGLGIALVVTWLFRRHSTLLADIRLHPKALLFSLIYIMVFLKELIVSNFDMARRVISPSLPVNPGIVEVKTKLRSRLGRMILANSITLTPGTFTVEIRDDSLFIHWIDVKDSDPEEATKMIVRKFEKYLEVMYG